MVSASFSFVFSLRVFINLFFIALPCFLKKSPFLPGVHEMRQGNVRGRQDIPNVGSREDLWANGFQMLVFVFVF